MKTCKDCNKRKQKKDFYGVQNECKECTKFRVRANSKIVGNAYDLSEKGVVRVIYKTQKRNNRIRGHGGMPYAKEDLSEWLYSNGFKGLYDNWVLGGYKKDDKPSVDRLDDHKGYSFKNIKLGTWLSNRKHQYRDITEAVGTGGKRCKSVIKLDKNKNKIADYVSYWSAARDVGYSIEYQIKKQVKCRGGFYWKYK